MQGRLFGLPGLIVDRSAPRPGKLARDGNEKRARPGDSRRVPTKQTKRAGPELGASGELVESREILSSGQRLDRLL